MKKLIEYLDHLPDETIEYLRGIIGHDWKYNFPQLPKETKLEIGRIVFGQEVRLVSLSFDGVPVIMAEPA